MGNIVGESFRQYVSEQIRVRQEKLGASTRNTEFFQEANGKTGWVKATSTAVGLAGDLAQQYVLFGGTFNGITNSRDGTYQSYNTGWPEQGPRPQPGIVSMETKNRNRGSVRETTLNIKAFDKAQFEYIDLLYMRLGYSVLIEFGHTVYYDNQGALKEIDLSNTLSQKILTGQYDNNVEKLRTDIQQKREALGGNYDGIFGRITNFSWTFSKDGTYDINLTLISYGDVVESLKINIGIDPSTIGTLPSGSSTDDNPTELSDFETIELSRDRNIFSRQFYDLARALDNAYVKGYTSVLADVTAFPSGPGTGPYYTHDAIRVDEYNAIDDTEYYYIRFGALLQFIWDRRMIYGGRDDSPVVGLDVDAEENLMYLPPYTVSTNLKICTIKRDVTIGGSTYRIHKDLPESSNVESEFPNVGKLLNVYLNMAHLLRKLDELKDDKNKIALVDFLVEICNDINSTLGGVNQLAPTVDEDTNTFYIAEETTLPDSEAILKKLNRKTTSELLRVYGLQPDQYGTFVLDFGIKTEISSQLASTLTIGAQANGTAPGEDATAFSTWNAGLIDRVTPEKKVDITATSGSTDIDITTLQNYVNYLAGLSEYDWDEVENGISDALTNLLDIWRSKNASETNTASNALGFIPINLTLTLQGLSGIKIYNKLEVDSTFLPRTYNDTLVFLIKGVSHKIENNQWTTNLDSLSVPRNVVSAGNTITTIIKPQARIAPNTGGTQTGGTSPGTGSTRTSPTYTQDPDPNFRARSIFGKSGITKGLWSDLGGPGPHLNSAIRSGLPTIWQNTNAWDLDIPAGASIYAIDIMTINSVGSYGPYDSTSQNPKLYGDYFTATLSDGTQAYFAHLGSLNSKVAPGGKLDVGEFVGTVAPASGFDPHLHLALSNGDLNQGYLDKDETQPGVTNPAGSVYNWKRIGTFKKVSPAVTLDFYQRQLEVLAKISAQVRNKLLKATGDTKDSQEIPRMSKVTKDLVNTLSSYTDPRSSNFKTETQAKQWLEQNVYLENGNQGYYVYCIAAIVESYKSPNTIDSGRENAWEDTLKGIAETSAPNLTYRTLLGETAGVNGWRNPVFYEVVIDL